DRFMARSMTGFARDQVSGPWGTLEWEARSVNHRYLDVRLRLPDALKAQEPGLREIVGKRLSRGKVELTARLDTARPDHAIDVDQVQLGRLAMALETICATVPGSRAPDALQLLQYPGIRLESEPDTDAIQAAATASLATVLDGLQSMRDSEGGRLAQMLRDRAQQIGAHADAATKRLPLVREAWYERLRHKLA